jgi:two-component system LytT family response regulator
MKHAVIVDDERPAAEELALLLEYSGKFKIDGVFTDPNEAIFFLKTRPADIAFIDIEMPEMDGFELAGRIKDLSAGVAVIFVSGRSEHAVEAFRLGGLNYVIKPVQPECLQSAFEKIPQVTLSERTGGSVVKAACFGKFAVTVNGVELNFGYAKAEELFAFLVHSGGKSIERICAVHSVFSDFEGARGRILLGVTLYYLQRTFADKGAHLKIEYGSGSFRIAMKTECDAVNFTNRIGALKPLSKSTIKKYEKVLALYTNDYFERNDYGWALKKRMDLKQKYTDLLFEMFRFYIEEGNTVKGIDTLMAGLRKDTSNKILNYELIKELKKSSELIALLKDYDSYRKHLEAEMGVVEPDSECNNLARN